MDVYAVVENDAGYDHELLSLACELAGVVAVQFADQGPDQTDA